ncbi:molybdenum cofactor biosynthesis protein A [Solidesulfovibrio carbinoliphilus subsp. oakridgensis]|uniref:GTP 3',8-cyclase n=1 Tax=Solidesulfovibrio carbinoliphilus subsp. oakridgensis TaxID=694327 RepID=G7QDP2_9BACT|nr:GTP 3',8-cyclase MoaA [Solidesulfovibrio carbinoliphilus]EHJ46548.1 molybdenum cofactor biosynthesis protein A [Solidesulfovibrio carbinoliphilus subsp. oakridgensis]
MTVAKEALRDGRGREVSYLRLSVTDRCNLSCLYCRPKDRISFIPHNDILRYEELLDLVSLGREMGISKVRLTGGEPFARKDVMVLVESIRRRFPEMDLRLTTNATLLAGKPALLAELGVTAVNISCDTLDREKYARITGCDRLDLVRRAIDESLAAGLRVKINAVALRGVNTDEIPAFVRLATDAPLDVRFIEFMPVGDGNLWKPENYIAAKDVLSLAVRAAELVPEENGHIAGGPARMYRIAGGLGRFGVISPLSEHFCDACNRLRITSDGKLRTCLFSDREYRLRPLLRNPKLGLRKVREVIALALRTKPLGYEVLNPGAVPEARNMSAIGG